MASLKKQLIRLGDQHPSLREHITHVLDELQAKTGRAKKAHSNFDDRTDAMLERMLKPHGVFPGPGHVKGVDLSSRTMEMGLTLLHDSTLGPEDLPTMQEAQDIAFQISEKLGARSYDAKGSRGEYEILLEFSIA